MDNNYRQYLELCLTEAQKSLNENCTPVAAALIKENEVVALARSNAPSDETDRRNAILHAELRLLLDNQEALKDEGVVLYTSLEPCLMCMGAIIVSRVSTVVWAVDDFWGGAYRIYDKGRAYIRQRLPTMVRTPFPDLQAIGAQMWVTYLNQVEHPEYIDKILKWQVKIQSDGNREELRQYL